MDKTKIAVPMRDDALRLFVASAFLGFAAFFSSLGFLAAMVHVTDDVFRYAFTFTMVMSTACVFRVDKMPFGKAIAFTAGYFLAWYAMGWLLTYAILTFLK